MPKTRNEFIKLAGLGLSSVPLLSFGQANIFSNTNKNSLPPIYLFSKHLQFLDYNNMSNAAAEMGFNGLDLTVRPKGHVIPEKVEQQLPLAVEAMTKHGLQISMMTTNVVNPSINEEYKVLKTASDLGFKHYRMGWLKYNEEQTIEENIEIFKTDFLALETINKKLNLIGGYQNHAGNHVGAPIWDLEQILKNTKTNYIGSQYDIRHAVVEGGQSWELGLKLIQSRIRSIVIKDFKWGQKNGVWKPINTPLGEGMVNFKKYFSLLKKYKINVPISLHLEYDLGGAEHGDKKTSINQKEVFKAMTKDLSFIRETWKNA